MKTHSKTIIIIIIWESDFSIKSELFRKREKKEIKILVHKFSFGFQYSKKGFFFTTWQSVANWVCVRKM